MTGRGVLTMGTFDLFHAGHVFLLEQCHIIAGVDNVTVALNSDDFAGRFKDRPVHTLHERTKIVAACRWVTQVVENTGNEDAAVVIDQIRPRFLVIGQDWALRDYYAQLGITQQWLDDRGISLLYVPRPAGSPSSTEMRHRVLDRVRPPDIPPPFAPTTAAIDRPPQSSSVFGTGITPDLIGDPDLQPAAGALLDRARQYGYYPTEPARPTVVISDNAAIEAAALSAESRAAELRSRMYRADEPVEVIPPEQTEEQWTEERRAEGAPILREDSPLRQDPILHPDSPYPTRRRKAK